MPAASGLTATFLECLLMTDSVDKVADEEGLGSVLERLALTLPTDA
jgi:hypothetical protein